MDALMPDLPRLTLGELLASTPGEGVSSMLSDALPDTLARIEIRHLVTDSRDLHVGDAFIALPGATMDGRQFVQSALGQGAAVVLIGGDTFSVQPVSQGDDPVCADGWVVAVPDIGACLIHWLKCRYVAAQTVALIAVTGTNGKSSVTQYIAQLATDLGTPCGVIGTLGNGVWPQLNPTRNTTPGLPIVYRALDDMARQGVTLAAVEVSSHGLDQGRVAGFQFDVAVLTNLTQDHLDYHGTMAHYAATKKRLFTDYDVKTALINIDDRYGQTLVDDGLPGNVLTFAQGDHVSASLRWTAGRLASSGMTGQLASPWGSEPLQVSLVGQFNLSNVTAAIGSLASMGLPFSGLVDSARRLRPVNGRMELYVHDSLPAVVVDFAHTPDALDNVLGALSALGSSISLVYGCGGDRDRTKRPLMTRIALAYADSVWLTDDNPRYEDPEQIWQDALDVDGSDTIHRVHDRADALREAIRQADFGSLVVVTGKGHEDYQEINGEKLPHSDPLTLRELGYSPVGERSAC